MTTIEDTNVRSRLRAQRTAYAILLGVTCAGFYADVAFYVITFHAFLWLVLLLDKGSTIRELEMDVTIADEERPHLVIVHHKRK